MRKVVFAPDSFKGTLSSIEVCSIMADAVRRFYPDAEMVSIPIADGGEGSVDAVLAAAGGEKIYVEASDPFFHRIPAFYGITGNATAVVEMAACAGLQLAGNTPDPGKTTTYGVGELILKAARAGRKRIYLCLGGSCTNDAGCGAAAAAGVRFCDVEGTEFIPTGETLSRISRIDMSGRDPALEGVEICALCDIDNPLYGETGAAYMFAPQKGADAEKTAFLDGQLRAFAAAAARNTGTDISRLKGGGAAGGMGAGAAVFFGASLVKGIDTILNIADFESKLRGCDILFTGEGKIDAQSLHGKTVAGVARRAQEQRIPVIVVAGDIGDGIEEIYNRGVSAVFSTNRVAVDFVHAKQRARRDLRETMESIMRLLGTMEPRAYQ